MSFPAEFAWGVATSAFQIEGATAADGRAPSIWDRYHQLGLMPEGRGPRLRPLPPLREDVALMADLGVDAYRFSIVWPRVVPDGETVNPAGLDF